MRRGFYPACLLMIAAMVALARGQQTPVSSSPAVIQTPVSIAQGGHGQVTAALGFDALAPTTTRGDLITRDASGNVRFAKCTSGQVLSWGANDPACASSRYLAHLGAGTTTLSATTHFSIGSFYSAAAGSGLQIAHARPCSVASTIIRIDFEWIMITAGTAETTALNLVKNGSTASTLAAAQTWNQTALARNDSTYTGLAVSCTALDNIEIDLNGSGTNFATDPVGLWSADITITIP